MKYLITKTTLFTSKLDSQTIRVMITIGSLLIFSLIAGAPIDSGSGA